MKKGMELTFSTIATLIAIFAVLLVVLMFFQGGFREIGTGKFATFTKQATPVQDTKIDALIGSIGGWFGKTCTADPECSGNSVCAYVCRSTTPKSVLPSTQQNANYCWYDDTVTTADTYKTTAVKGKNAFKTKATCETYCGDACTSTTDDCYTVGRCVG